MTDSTPSEHEAVAALERLGLSNYEARVFLALQRLGVGTAKAVYESAGVPRSQVYGATEQLEARGLVESQSSTPKRFRPVSLDVACERLRAELDRDQRRAFDYLASIQSTTDDREHRDGVWTVRGGSPVDGRVCSLVETASDAVIYGAPTPALVSDDVVSALRACTDRGVEVTVVSESRVVRNRFVDDSFAVYTLVAGIEGAGRVVLVDDDAILLSVLAADGSETAIWTAETSLADVLVRIVRGGLLALASE